ncbi:MAG TPA: hypothetical protein VN222_13045 [Novosphingobium sp.]|nr:hypothetical protein [Novosphingobium sp.]
MKATALAATLIVAGIAMSHTALAQSASQPQVITANPRGSDAPAVLAPDPATANSPVAPSLPADPAYHGQPYMGALSAPPADALGKTYPLCHGAVQDECVNADQR